VAGVALVVGVAFGAGPGDDVVAGEELPPCVTAGVGEAGDAGGVAFGEPHDAAMIAAPSTAAILARIAILPGP
jgi:class 3 adenylate cyclase